MSRNIDLSKPLSDDDKKYLRDRNRGHLIPADAPAKAPEVETVTDAGQVKAPPELPTAKVEDASEDDKSSEDGTEEAGEYGSMKAEELKALLTARGLPTSGSKAELRARLEESDQES